MPASKAAGHASTEAMMRKKSKEKVEGKKKTSIRTTISLNPLVDSWLKEITQAMGFNSASDTIAELIRRKKEEGRSMIVHKPASGFRDKNGGGPDGGAPSETSRS